MKAPDAFLEVIGHDLATLPGLTGLSVGYENREWRTRQFARHLLEWLPEFALSFDEQQSLGTHNAMALLEQAARTVYTTEKYGKRGEFGELLLHAALRQVFGTVPAISKIFFKSANNDPVKGFDAVHVVASPARLELWLGEAKFYDDAVGAISSVVEELHKHTARDYLREEFTLISKKIEDAWPHAERLKKLLHRNTSLDEVFDVACFPVLLTYDSPTVCAHDATTEAYRRDFESEIRRHHGAFVAKGLPTIRIHLFLVPLASKLELIRVLHEGLKKWQ